MANTTLLQRKLHTLTSDEVRVLRRIAAEVFEPLTRPFRQKRTEVVFSFRNTVRHACRSGELMANYEERVREHRKSRLVIAMSLSGIDRCAAVSLIPLLNELQQFLNFRLFIYTDALVPAQFTRDGFLENDIDIAWNNVNGPGLFHALGQITFDKQEDTLLIIDNLGGGDSRWFSSWGWDQAEAVREAQRELLGYSWREKAAQEFDGDFSTVHKSSYLKSLKSWEKIVLRNASQRWVEAPAMVDYLARWLFHPQFGRKKHGLWTGGSSWHTYNAQDYLKQLRGKFKHVHWLRTIPHPDRSTLNSLLWCNTIDYTHEADTIEDFAQVLANIVHGRCTDRLTRDPITFAELIDEPEEEDEREGTGELEEHVEVFEGKEKCFANVVKPETTVPKETGITVTRHERGTTHTKEVEIPYKLVDVSAAFPWNLDISYGSPIIDQTPDFNITPAMSKFSLIEEAEKVLSTVRSRKIICTDGGGITTASRKGVLTESPNYARHHTQKLEPHVVSYLSLWSEDYAPYTKALPLTNVLWCTGGLYHNPCLGYSVPYQDTGRWRQVVFHEHGHHMEQICPAIGCFTNQLIETKTGGVDHKRMVPVYAGKAMPVISGSTPWITPYAGKWYGRLNPNLPIITEIVSVHGEYFQSPETLLKLMLHDPFMTRFMCFLFMGGPLAYMKSTVIQEKQKALEAVQQKQTRERGYSTRTSYRRRGGGGGRRSYSSGRTKRTKGTNSFGV